MLTIRLHLRMIIKIALIAIHSQVNRKHCVARDAPYARGMKATIWHNPNCSKSRAALAMLEARGDIAVEVIRYLEQPPSAETLVALYDRAGMHPREGLRLSGTDAAERGLPDADAATILAAMAADPRLIERPLVETDKGVRLARPTEVLEEIL